LAHVFGGQRGFIAGFSGLRGIAGGNYLDTTRSTYFRYPDERRQAEAWFCDEDEKGREVYVCAHLLKARRRIKANATLLSTLYVDGDGAHVPPDVPSPTAVIESSPGREQFYLRLTRPVVPEVGESLNRRLALAMGADRSGWDLTQLLRPPGTHNHKYHDTPLVVLREMTNVTYDPDELDRLLPPLLQDDPKAAAKSCCPKEIGPAPELSRLSSRMRDLIRHGNRGEYRTRSDADFAACIAMFGAGYETGEVWATMTDHTNGISEKFLEKGRYGERYLALTIGNARARAEISLPKKTSRSRARRMHKGAARA
jgi:hypothetical protein